MLLLSLTLLICDSEKKDAVDKCSLECFPMMLLNEFLGHHTHIINSDPRVRTNHRVYRVLGAETNWETSCNNGPQEVWILGFKASGSSDIHRYVGAAVRGAAPNLAFPPPITNRAQALPKSDPHSPSSPQTLCTSS